MRGHCILSHGFESGPDATKVTALAEVAERLGWSCERPDYTDLDGRREVSELGDVPARLRRLRTLADVSGLVSLQVPVAGLFLMAPPIRMGEAHPFDAAGVPISIVHGWDDELCPTAEVVEWAGARRARLLLVGDGHRLSDHVATSANAFEQLLAGL